MAVDGCVPRHIPSHLRDSTADTATTGLDSATVSDQALAQGEVEAVIEEGGLGDQVRGETKSLSLPPELAAVVGMFAPRAASTCTIARRALVRAAVRGDVRWGALGSAIIQAVVNKHASTLTAFLEGAADVAVAPRGRASALGAQRWVHTAFAALLRASASTWQTTRGGVVGSDSDETGRRRDRAVASALLQLIEWGPTEGKLSTLDLELTMRHFPDIVGAYVAKDRLGLLRGSFSWEQVVTVAARWDEEELARYALVRVEELEDPAAAMAAAASCNSHRTLACLLARAECDPRACAGALLYRAASEGHVEAFRVLLASGATWSDPDGVRILRSALAAAPAAARAALAHCVRDLADLSFPPPHLSAT